jgi:peptidoglycan/LPS O-acetylase OafA/YrhL
VNVRAERFPLFDSLRAVAALSVLAAHAALFAGMYTSDSFLRPYVSQLGAGITIFYVISGFLLYRPFVRARFADEPRPSTSVYAWRRLLRIVPAYWLALTVIAVWLSMSPVVKPAWHALVLYGFGQVYSTETIPLGLQQAGTLCVEVTFYAFLPLWALAGRRRGFRAELAALALLWLFSLVWKLVAFRYVTPFAVDSGPWLATLPGVLDDFAVGMTIAVLSARGLPPALERAVRRSWPWWLAAAAAFVVVCRAIDVPRAGDGGAYLARHELLTLMAAALIVPAVFAWERRDAVRRLLGRRELLYVGLVSYGVYLWHYALVQKVATGTRGWMTDTLGLGPTGRFLLLLAIGLAASVAIASVSYHALERPLMALGRRATRRPGREQPDEALREPTPASTIARS